MVPRNLFETASKYIDFRKYEDLINEKLNNFVGSLKKHFAWIDSKKILEMFWDIVDKNLTPNPHNLNVKIVLVAGRFITLDLLLEDKKINKLEFDIFHQWYKYLCERVIPYVHKIPDNFFGSLLSGIPLINVDPIVSLFKKANKSFSQTPNLKELLLDKKVDAIKKIMKFENHYMKLYPVVLNKCELFGLELGKHEGGKKYQADLRRIFHLSQRNAEGKIIREGGKFKPPMLLDYILNSLVHIRNAISHPDRGGIRLINKDTVKIIDCKPSGEITYEKEYNFPGLWQVIYILTLLELGLENMALFIDVFKHAMFIERKHNIWFMCDCNHFAKYFILPSTQLLICKKCGKPHSTNKLLVSTI